MEINKKYKKNGYECSMCPFTGDNVITQFAYSNYSHAGSTAIDVADGNEKKAYYAPATVKCVKIDTTYCFTWWQTVDKVWQPNGILDYATYMFGHDESMNCNIGQIIEQGVQIGNYGAGGNATGVHCHIETARGLQNGWIPNSSNVYVLPNASLLEEVCFMDDSNFVNMDMKDSDFHYTSEISKSRKVDQILQPGDWFELPDVYPIHAVNGVMDAWTSEILADKPFAAYNYIDAQPCIECNEYGSEQCCDQTISIGNYAKIPGRFQVIDNDALTNAVCTRIGRRDVWIKAEPCVEVDE